MVILLDRPPLEWQQRYCSSPLGCLLSLRLPTEAQANERAVSGVALTSPNPGELAITWDAPSTSPDDYRVTWKKSTTNWPSYKNDNTVEGGNAFPTGTSHTVTGLEEDAAYKVRLRARYHRHERQRRAERTLV